MAVCLLCALVASIGMESISTLATADEEQSPPRDKPAANPDSKAKTPPQHDSKSKGRAKGDTGKPAEKPPAADKPRNGDDDDDAPVRKTDKEWKKLLTAKQYRVTRKKETEAPFTGKYAHSTKQGTYRCVCCGAKLFASETKFESGTGWPSFYQPVRAKSIKKLPDYSDNQVRIEVQCARCEAHLGHVFDDGPEPTGLRFCINSASLKLEEKKP
jgi:peptide-methionine (R)-S-oxide reductase